jgi:hypothetical protein
VLFTLARCVAGLHDAAQGSHHRRPPGSPPAHTRVDRKNRLTSSFPAGHDEISPGSLLKRATSPSQTDRSASGG